MLVVLMGVCGCGKTEVGRILADRLSWSFHDADQFHPPANVQKMTSHQALTDEDRLPWLESMASAIRQWLETEADTVLACSALKDEYRQILSGGSPHVRFVHLKGSKYLIQQRLTERSEHFMPAELLDSQLRTLEEPEDAIVVDITPTPQEIAQSIEDALKL